MSQILVNVVRIRKGNKSEYKMMLEVIVAKRVGKFVVAFGVWCIRRTLSRESQIEETNIFQEIVTLDREG